MFVRNRNLRYPIQSVSSCQLQSPINRTIGIIILLGWQLKCISGMEFLSYMKKNNASTGLKRKTFRSYFFAKSLLNRLKSKDAKDKITPGGWEWGKKPSRVHTSRLKQYQTAVTSLHSDCYKRLLTQTSLTPNSCSQEHLMMVQKWSDGHWTPLCHTRDGITLSCSSLHHRKEDLYLFYGKQQLSNRWELITYSS